jgi:branched-chain amino acid aminotransferase
MRVSERPITIDETVAAAKSGALQEVWATGTAAVISPIGELAYKGEHLVVNGGRIGPTAQKLYDTIVSIQYGAASDPHGWTVVVGGPDTAPHTPQRSEAPRETRGAPR